MSKFPCFVACALTALLCTGAAAAPKMPGEPDGRRIAFQVGFSDDAPGSGRGVLLMDLPAGF